MAIRYKKVGMPPTEAEKKRAEKAQKEAEAKKKKKSSKK